MVFVLVFLAGCASAPKAPPANAPEWTRGQYPKKYTDTRYFVAVGSGSSSEEADSSGVKALGRVFSQKVQSQLTSKDSSQLNESTSSASSGQSTSEVQSELRIESSMTLRGAQTVERFEDSAGHTHYALVVLDKLRLKNLYRMELEKIGGQVTALLQEHQKSPRVSSVKEIAKQIEHFDALNVDYAFLNSGRGVARPISALKLQQLLSGAEELKKASPIVLSFSGAYREFSDLVAACLGQDNFHILPEGQPVPEKSPRVTFALAETQKHLNTPGWVKFEYSATATVTRAGSQVGTTQVSELTTGRDPSMCFDKAKANLSSQLCQKIVEIINR